MDVSHCHTGLLLLLTSSVARGQSDEQTLLFTYEECAEYSAVTDPLVPTCLCPAATTDQYE